MARPAPRDDEQSIDPDVVAIAHVTRCEPFRGNRHPPQPILVQRHRGGFFAAARLDLDKGKGATTPGNNVDFAARYACAPRENVPAAQAQKPAGEGLRATSPLLGLVAVQRDRSSARA